MVQNNYYYITVFIASDVVFMCEILTYIFLLHCGLGFWSFYIYKADAGPCDDTFYVKVGATWCCSPVYLFCFCAISVWPVSTQLVFPYEIKINLVCSAYPGLWVTDCPFLISERIDVPLPIRIIEIARLVFSLGDTLPCSSTSSIAYVSSFIHINKSAV